MNSNTHIKQLNEMIINATIYLSNETIDIFQEIENDNKRMFDNLQIPLEELCNYANGSDEDIDKTIRDALNQVHQQLIKLIDTIQNDFINKIPSEDNPRLINENLEDEILWYIRLVGIIFPILILIIGIIPIIFFIFIIICRLCHSKQNVVSSDYR